MDYSILNDIVNSPDELYLSIRILIIIVSVLMLIQVLCFNVYHRKTVRDYKKLIDDYIETEGKRLVSTSYNKEGNAKRCNTHEFIETEAKHQYLAKHPNGIVTVNKD